MCEGQGPGAIVANSRININPRFISILRRQQRRKLHGEREASPFPTIASLPRRIGRLLLFTFPDARYTDL